VAKRKHCMTCGKSAHGRDLKQLVDPTTGRIVDVCIDNPRCSIPFRAKKILKEGA